MKEILLFLILLIGLFCDFLTYKIPNKLILCGAVGGSLVFLFERGLSDIPILIIGFLIPVCVLILPYGIGALGAGDVKLFSIMTAFIGIKPTLICMIFSFCVGAVISLLILLYNKSLIRRLKKILIFLFTVVRTGKVIPYYDTNKDGYKYVMHFSLAIFLGTAFYFVWKN